MIGVVIKIPVLPTPQLQGYVATSILPQCEPRPATCFNSRAGVYDDGQPPAGNSLPHRAPPGHGEEMLAEDCPKMRMSTPARRSSPAFSGTVGDFAHTGASGGVRGGLRALRGHDPAGVLPGTCFCASLMNSLLLGRATYVAGMNDRASWVRSVARSGRNA